MKQQINQPVALNATCVSAEDRAGTPVRAVLILALLVSVYFLCWHLKTENNGFPFLYDCWYKIISLHFFTSKPRVNISLLSDLVIVSPNLENSLLTRHPTNQVQKLTE